MAPPHEGGRPARIAAARRPARSALRSAAATVAAVVAAAVVLLATPAPGGAQGAGGGTPAERLRQLTTEKAEVLVHLARTARDALTDENRCGADRSCACSQSGCARTVPSSLKCSDRLGADEETCQDEEGAAGSCVARKLDYTMSYVNVAPNLLEPSGSTAVPGLGEEICLTRSLDPIFVRAAVTDNGPWTYFASAKGMARFFPGTAFEGGDDYTQCGAYDARLRPWFVSGSLGETDVVVLVDVSKAMSEPVGPLGADADKTRSSLVFDSVKTILGMFQESDTVSVVAYGLSTETGVEVLSPTGGMESATNKVQRQMLERLASMNTSQALADPVAGLETAFDVLETGIKKGGQTAGCNRVIIMLGGSPSAKTKCEAVCAQDRTRPCRCVADAMARVERRQAALAESAGRSAIIATTTVGVGADDGLLRQAACLPRSSGMWSHLRSSSMNVVSALQPLFRLLSSSQWTPNPPDASKAIATRIYPDAGGYGLVTTLMIAVWGSADRDKELLGVVGTDVILSRLLEAADGSQEVLNAELDARAPRCTVNTTHGRPLMLTPCQIQAARGDYNCPALADPTRRARELTRYDCWRATKRVYVPYTEKVTRADAAALCAERLPGGTLATFAGVRENALAASLLPEDGAWIGMRLGDEDRWMADRPETDDATSSQRPLPFFASWAPGQPATGDKGDDADLTCAAADRRGTVANWFVADCKGRRPLLCSFPVDRLPDARTCAETTLAFDDRSFLAVGQEAPEANPDVESASCKDPTDTFDRSSPSCGGLFASPMCPFGDVDQTCANICCPGCRCRVQLSAAPGSGSSGTLSTGEIIGIVAGVGVGLAVVAGLAALVYRRRGGHEELPLPPVPGMVDLGEEGKGDVDLKKSDEMLI